MKKIIKLLLLLLISLTVDSKTICNSTCPLKAFEANVKSAKNGWQPLAENDWILSSQFKY